MSDWKDRLKTETEELAERLKKLDVYLDGGPSIDQSDLTILQYQHAAMNELLIILKERCRRAGITPECER